MTSEPDETAAFDPPDPVTERIGHNVTEFLVGLPACILPSVPAATVKSWLKAATTRPPT
jgi:hypothetical protein